MKGFFAASIIILISGFVIFITGCQGSEQRIRAEMENLIIPADFREVIDTFKEIHITFFVEDVALYSQHYLYETGDEISGIQTDRVSLIFGKENDQIIVTAWFDSAGNIIEAKITQAAHPVDDVEVLVNVMIEGIMLLFKVDKYLKITGQPYETTIGEMKASIHCFETAKSPGKGIDTIRLYIADFGEFQTILGREVIEKEVVTTALIVDKIILH